MVTQAPFNQILNDGQTVKGLRKHGLLLACLLLGFAVAAQGWADVIVLHPLDSTDSGAFSNLDLENPSRTPQQIADSFSLSQATVLESISWFGRYGAVLSLT